MVHEYAYFYEYIWKSVHCIDFPENQLTKFRC